jgi:hypothetical protein
MAYWSYRDIQRHNTHICNAKFGLEFNVKRQKLGIPEIPANWYVEHNFAGSVSWQAKDSVIGHQSKDISIDSSCTLKYEEDKYYLKRLNGKKREVNVYFKYGSGKVKDSVFFWYYDGDATTRSITRNIADSIFAAEKIKKDY